MAREEDDSSCATWVSRYAHAVAAALLTPNQVTIADLRSIFSKYGSLHSINLPLDGTTGAPRGFAFVYYLSKSSAEKALEAVNGTRIYSGMAQERIDSEGGKGGNKKEVRLAKKAAEKEQGGGGGERGRVVAVDWAVGKDEFKRAQVDVVPQEGEAESGEDEDEDEEESDEEKDDDSDMSPVPEGADASPEPARHADDDDDELDEEPKGPEPAKGTTLFVRNMSFEATESELYDLCAPLPRTSGLTVRQVQGFRTRPLRPDRVRPDDKAIARDGLCVLLERRGCAEGPVRVGGAQCGSLRRGTLLPARTSR